MKHYHKKIFALFFTLSFLIALPLNTLAATPQISNELYYQYIQLKEEGILGDDITFDIWEQFVDSNESQKQIFEIHAQSQFKLVYSGETRATDQFPLCPGDVIITSSSNTGVFGLTGHAGIAVNTTDILHMV